MQIAFRLAEEAADAGEVPVGAVIIARDGQILGRAHNQVKLLKDPTAHAEVLAITQAASAIGDWRLQGCTLYVTKEPCPMCAGAVVLSRLARVVWGVSDPQRGGAVSRFQIFDCNTLNHQPKWQAGILEDECRQLVQSFFRERRVANGE